jgi:hypothetical protein
MVKNWQHHCVCASVSLDGQVQVVIIESVQQINLVSCVELVQNLHEARLLYYLMALADVSALRHGPVRPVMTTDAQKLSAGGTTQHVVLLNVAHFECVRARSVTITSSASVNVSGLGRVRVVINPSVQ